MDSNESATRLIESRIQSLKKTFEARGKWNDVFDAQRNKRNRNDRLRFQPAIKSKRFFSSIRAKKKEPGRALGYLISGIKFHELL